MRVGLVSSCIRSLRRCTAPCRCSTATQELRGRGYQFMRCNIVGTRVRSSSRCRREVPKDRNAGRNPVAERRVPCKTVLEVNDNSGRRIPGRLTFESKEPRLKLYASDSSARFFCAASPSSLPSLLLLHLFIRIPGLPLSRPSHFRSLFSIRAIERTSFVA